MLGRWGPAERSCTGWAGLGHHESHLACVSPASPWPGAALPLSRANRGSLPHSHLAPLPHRCSTVKHDDDVRRTLLTTSPDQRSAGYRSHSDASSLLSRIQSDNTPTLPSPQLPWNPSLAGHADLFGNGRTAQFLNSLEPPDAGTHLPPFVRPLPSKIAPEDVQYLHAKGALTLPSTPLQNGLLQSYVEYVHPYMPLMDLHGFLNIVNRRDGLNGQTSLLLYQAMMFSATAFVDMKYLREAGYATRKAARKAFFQKTRVS